MRTYLISYDLGKPETRIEYGQLASNFKKLFITWARPVESVWIVKTDMNVEQIRDAIKKILDSNDKLVVVEMSGSWGTYNISKEVTDWMKKNI